MNGLVSIVCILAMLLAAGAALSLGTRVAWRWLGAAALLVLVNDALLTRCYGLVPDLVPGLAWNWQGKLGALAATLAIAALPAFGWRASGITLRQAGGSVLPCALVALVYAALFFGLALAFPGDAPTPEALAFQLTMPGLEEEAFYRGLLLLALDRAFPARMRWLGVDWGWGAIVSSALFGLAHAFGFGKAGFSFEPMVFALTAVPSLLAVWLRLRSGSIAWPVAVHNFGNAVGYLV
jgi:membrane protease YdiL (CAAX protease family)